MKTGTLKAQVGAGAGSGAGDFLKVGAGAEKNSFGSATLATTDTDGDALKSEIKLFFRFSERSRATRRRGGGSTWPRVSLFFFQTNAGGTGPFGPDPDLIIKDRPGPDPDPDTDMAGDNEIY